MSEPYEIKLGLCSCGCGEEFPIEQMVIEGEVPYCKEHLERMLKEKARWAMNKKELKKLQQDNKTYLEAWVSEGRKLTTYDCNHCGKKIKTPQPEKKQVSGKGYWDSCKTCSECGKLNFVAVYPNGKTNSVKM